MVEDMLAEMSLMKIKNNRDPRRCLVGLLIAVGPLRIRSCPLLLSVFYLRGTMQSSRWRCCRCCSGVVCEGAGGEALCQMPSQSSVLWCLPGIFGSGFLPSHGSWWWAAFHMNVCVWNHVAGPQEWSGHLGGAWFGRRWYAHMSCSKSRSVRRVSSLLGMICFPSWK